MRQNDSYMACLNRKTTKGLLKMLAPDLSWLQSFCMLVPLVDCEHQLLAAARKNSINMFVL